MDELTQAADLLQQHYGRLDLDGYRSDWVGCVRYILERQWSPKKFAKSWPELAETWLVDVDEVARVRREELWDLLQSHSGSASLVAFLHKLAKWWDGQVTAGHDPLESEFARFEPESEDPSTEWQREVFRQDRSLAARLACVIFGSTQFPVTRGIWRAACRHNWISWHDDPADTPGHFEQGLARNQIDFAQFAEWMILLGDDFCGPKPKCLGCPLLPLLGPEGPCEPDE